MTYEEFTSMIDRSINIITLDLDELEKIANKVNENQHPESTTSQTTTRPGDEVGQVQSKPQISRCTIPMAMVCFATIDMFGKWINNTTDTSFKGNAKIFFTRLANKDDIKNSTTADKFEKMFRHSTMHSFFAQGHHGLAYPDEAFQSLFFTAQINQDTLNIKYLVSVVREGMSQLSSELTNEQSELSNLIFERYKIWLASE